ncbi:MAG: RagB/SusD family nutrient uptake outer membrane protein [Bacteroidales bacterium]|nr:RagB/SusD family nutrient uptake outer membrane protein [Bacteroidales bacterium]MBO7567656.1 RagB/SusD family nutrient uptake outer membrane protein [Bacteroidales bacterium]
MMKLNKILTVSAVAALMLTSCDDMFEPAIEQHPDFEQQIVANPSYFYGLLMTPYSKFNDQNTFFAHRVHEDFATSDFYSDQSFNDAKNWILMGRGSWTAKENPVDKWSDVRESMQYINIFLENMDRVTWSKNKDNNDKFKKRLTGEAYALRGILNYFFLRAHAGYVEGESQMMGIPILTSSEDVNSDFNLPRQTFKASLDQIMADLDAAIGYLPEVYTGNDLVNGQGRNGLINGTIVRAMRSEVALMAASPLYAAESGITMQQAADYAAEVLKGHSIVPDGHTWYCHTAEINALNEGALPPEVIWRGDRTGENDVEYERHAYPPSLDGNGRFNPTQNLVDAFPMANGYPITAAGSGYDPQKPYDNRDPRLDTYIIHHGSTFKGTTINVSPDDNTNKDGLNRSGATFTGYYLKKFMNEDVDPNTSKPNGRRHYKARLRYTEIFLNYAEAQNEAAGPQSTGTLGMSPYDIVKAIRQRGGITNDQYLESIKGDKDKMRELIHNERRIELMGENFRFWDLRRWKEPLNETVKRMNVTNGKFNVETIDELRYEDYMYFGPMPEKEVLKWSNLKQNQGW